MKAELIRHEKIIDELENTIEIKMWKLPEPTKDKDTVVFIEVKTRESLAYGLPFEDVNSAKKRKIANVALLYLKRFKEVPPCRFDVVSINYENEKPQFELIKDAFEV